MSVPQSANGMKRSKQEIEKASLLFFHLSSRRIVTSLLLFGLIIEWLLPLTQLEAYTELYRIGPLITAIGLSLAVGLFVPPMWISFFLNGVICVGTVLVMFRVQYPSLYESLLGLVHGLRTDAIAMMDGKLQLSGESRTLLLIAGLGMMAAAVQSLMWLRQWGLGLTALTAVYLLMLYGFLGLDVFPGLLRACAEGLLLSVLLTVPRMERLSGAVLMKVNMKPRNYPQIQLQNQQQNQQQNQLQIQKQKQPGKQTGSLSLFGWPVSWWSGAALLAVIVAAAGIGAAWGRPLLQSLLRGQRRRSTGVRTILGSSIRHPSCRDRAWIPIENKGGLGSAGITGYGFDDRVLGAPITLDKTVLFTVQSPEATYLRGESKSIYNGHGWEQPEHQLEERLIGKGETSPAIASSDLISARSHGGIVKAASAPLDGSRAGSEGVGSKEITAS